VIRIVLSDLALLNLMAASTRPAPQRMGRGRRDLAHHHRQIAKASQRRLDRQAAKRHAW